MSKTYELISESLNEIINDLEENDGKNLKREKISIENNKMKSLYDKKLYDMNYQEKIFEQSIMK